jgi:hypothetical protein
MFGVSVDLLRRVRSRRRDVTEGAPSSGSRVSPLLVHRATPADEAPRVGTAVLLLPGPSVVKQRFIRGETQNAPPASVRRWGVSNRSRVRCRSRSATAYHLDGWTLRSCLVRRPAGSAMRSTCSTSTAARHTRRLRARRSARPSSRRTGSCRCAVDCRIGGGDVVSCDQYSGGSCERFLSAMYAR